MEILNSKVLLYGKIKYQLFPRLDITQQHKHYEKGQHKATYVKTKQSHIPTDSTYNVVKYQLIQYPI